MPDILFQKFISKLLQGGKNMKAFCSALHNSTVFCVGSIVFVGRFQNRICFVSNHHTSRIGKKIKFYNDSNEETEAATADS